MAELLRDGLDGTVREDEPDPLGVHRETVIQILKKKGLPVEDEQFRNRHLLSSTSFDPALYLSNIHGVTDSDGLRQGLDYLSRAMDQKSASLKVLVESNFERFVRAKSTIDNVHTAMRNQGAEPESERQTHSRHSSRTSTHFRSTSGQLSGPGRSISKPISNDKKKLALTKESEYGVQGIKGPLTEVAAKAEEVYGPALSSRERANQLRALLGSLEECSEVIDLMAEIETSITQRNYDKVVQDFTKAREFVQLCGEYAEAARRTQTPLSDEQVGRCVITAKVMANIEYQVDTFKRGIWRDLTSVQANLTMSTDRSRQDDHVALISVLLSLGVEDNPIWVWLLSRYDYLKNKLNSTFERSRVEIEVFRRRLANADKPSVPASAVHLRSPNRSNVEDRLKHLDTAPILELWDLIVHAIGNLLSVQGGILAEILDFWEKAQSFIDGKAQRNLPQGIDGASEGHHRLSMDGTKALQDGVIELVDILRGHILSFFLEPPVEDISLLFSPLPNDSPNTPRTPKSATLSAFSKPDMRFNLDLLTPPPPSPKRDESWEKFAFWPPYANSLSGVHYLGKLMVLVGTASVEMSSLTPIAADPAISERLRSLVNAIRERSSRAICAAWERDADSCKVMEDWARGSSSAYVTCWPSYFESFESFILSGSQKILYIPEAAPNKGGFAEIVTPPPKTLLNTIRRNFLDSVFRALNGVVNNASAPSNDVNNPWAITSDSSLDKRAQKQALGTTRDAVNASNPGLRLLLTLSNISEISSTVIPALVGQFETGFSITLTEDVGTLNSVLSNFEQQLFQLYTRPNVEKLSTIIHSGISSQSWVPTTPHPTEVRRHVYNALLHLVEVHSEASTTAPLLVPKILRYLLEQSSQAFLDAFKMRGRYTLPALMQATLDVEFFAQTLSPYASEKSTQTQAEIYSVLDQGTDSAARSRLQNELLQMKTLLKNLRDGTRGEFACFRRAKR